jgi:hypothetical protein
MQLHECNKHNYLCIKDSLNFLFPCENLGVTAVEVAQPTGELARSTRSCVARCAQSPRSARPRWRSVWPLVDGRTCYRSSRQAPRWHGRPIGQGENDGGSLMVQGGGEVAEAGWLDSARQRRRRVVAGGGSGDFLEQEGEVGGERRP